MAVELIKQKWGNYEELLHQANISKLGIIHSLDSVCPSVFTKFKKRFAIVRALQNLISELLHSATKSGLPKLTAVSLLLTYLLTPWCRVLLEKLTGLQLVKKFPAFHGTRRSITALTSVRHLSLSWARPIQSIYPPPTSCRSILILSTHLRLGLPTGLFPSGFPTKTLYTPLSSPILLSITIKQISPSHEFLLLNSLLNLTFKTMCLRDNYVKGREHDRTVRHCTHFLNSSDTCEKLN